MCIRDRLKTADQFAFNYNFKFPDFTLYNSQFVVSGNKGDLAWAGIGQYKDLSLIHIFQGKERKSRG